MAGDAGCFVGRVLGVGIDRQRGIGAELERAGEPRSERGALASIARVPDDESTRGFRFARGPVRGPVVDDEDGLVAERRTEALDDAADASLGLKSRHDREHAHGRDASMPPVSRCPQTRAPGASVLPWS